LAKLILTGDINLMNVTDPGIPFALVGNEFRAADVVFGNLERCLCEPPGGHSPDHEGFFADPLVAGEALTSAGVQAVGIANNVNAWISTGRPTARAVTEYLLLSKRTRQVLDTATCVARNPSNRLLIGTSLARSASNTCQIVWSVSSGCRFALA